MAKKVATRRTPAARTPATHTPATQAPATQAPATQAPATQTPASDTATVAANPYAQMETYKFLFVLAVILLAIGWLGLNTGEERRDSAWLAILILLAAFAVVTGRAITGNWRGILIDARNKLSLSRLQMISWTLVVLSAILTAALANVSSGWEEPLDIEIPSELWVLIGISTASLVASPAILSTKAKREANADEVEAMENKSGATEEINGLLACNRRPEDARWADLLMGEEVGNYGHVDLGKMQMFLFTFILVLSYAAAIASMFREGDVITGLPKVEEGMNVLLGISHTGYLANKTVGHTKEESTDA